MKLLVFLLLPCLSLSEVVKDFSKCDQFFLNFDPPKFTPAPPDDTVKKICQCVWDDNDEQKFLYATLYNTDWKIPIYSAYVFKTASVGRCDPWYIEPQLDDTDINAEPCMAPQGRKKKNNQAKNSDYEGSGYNKGHLYPVMHTDNSLSMLATSTLTNAAPQNPAFNQGAWKKHENAVIEDLIKCDSKAFVVTGVVPDHTIKLKNRVTVSKYYWRATCCLQNGEITGQGYFGPDGNNMKLTPLSIKNLQRKLATDYGVTIIIFPNVPTEYKISLKGGCN